jgi:hypothetical protein
VTTPAERLRKLKPIQIGRVDQGETYVFMPKAVRSIWPEVCAVVEAAEHRGKHAPEGWCAEAVAALARRMDEEGL